MTPIVTTGTIVEFNLISTLGKLGDSKTFTVDGFSITATGFDALSGPKAWRQTPLYAKDENAGEQGLGIANDPTGDHEIWGKAFIQIFVGTGVTEGLKNFFFEMGSTTDGEGWDVYGANGTGPGTVLTLLYKDGTDQNEYGLPNGYLYYDFFYDGGAAQPCRDGNVLLELFGADPGSSTSNPPIPGVPETSSWAMMLVGFAGLAFTGYRRTRKAAGKAEA